MSLNSSADKSGFRLKAVSSLGLAIGIGRLAQAVAFFMMAQILEKEDMGTVALLTIIFAGLFQLTNLGFDRYLVYAGGSEKEDMHAWINAIWTMQLIRGLLVITATLIFPFIIPGNWQLDISLTQWLTIGLAVLLMSCANPGISIYERSGDFSYVARVRAWSTLFGALTNIAVVLIWPSPWAYLAGQIATAFLFAGLSLHYTTVWPRLLFSRERFGQVLSYSKYLLAIAVFSYLSAQFQNYYVGAVFGSATLGMYYTWYRLVNLPRELVTQLQTQVLFAKASDEARRGTSIMRTHLKGFTLLVLLLMPFHIFVWFHGDFLMRILGGEGWVEFWWAGKVMAASSVAFFLSGTISPFMLVHVPRVSSILRSLEAVATVILILLLGPIYGVSGVLYSVLAILVVALLGRGVVLYTMLITIDRWVHARALIAVLGMSSLPFLAVEAGLPFLYEGVWEFIMAAGLYAAMSLALLYELFRRRGLIFG